MGGLFWIEPSPSGQGFLAVLATCFDFGEDIRTLRHRAFLLDVQGNRVFLPLGFHIRAGFFLSRESENRAEGRSVREPLIILLVPVIYWPSLAIWVPGTGWEDDNRGEFIGRPPARPSTRQPRLFYLSAHGTLGKNAIIPAQLTMPSIKINPDGQSQPVAIVQARPAQMKWGRMRRTRPPSVNHRSVCLYAWPIVLPPFVVAVYSGFQACANKLLSMQCCRLS